MAIEIVEKYVNELIDRSTMDEPVEHRKDKGRKKGFVGLY